MREKRHAARRAARTAVSSRFVVLTGLSGSGKSQAIRALEDLGYFCVDNLPVTLLPMLAELTLRAGSEFTRAAVVVDVREGRLLKDFPAIFRRLKAMRNLNPVLIFLESGEGTLVRRFSETRRPHPAAEGGALEAGIRREREAMRGLREVADRIVDTSALTVHELRATLRELVERPETGALTVSLVSFGFKYGLPTDADIVLDCRFLPNPFFVEELRHKAGTDPAVATYVLRRDEAQEFLARVFHLLAFALPGYQREGKSYLTIALGCTGGRHRSIVLVEELRRRLEAAGHHVLVRHRDAER